MNKKENSTSLSKVKGSFDFIDLVKNISIPLVGGIVVGILTKGNIDTYEKLKKPIFTAPSFIFPVVWTILYILIGIAAYKIYSKNRKGINDNGAYFYYLVNLLINLLWPFVFFSFRLYGISFVIIITLFIMAILTTIRFFKVDKIASYLMIPYVLWIGYASILNYFIWMYNEM